MLTVKRDPQAIAVAVNAVLLAVGLLLHVDQAVLGLISAVVVGVAGVVQYANVLGSDKGIAACQALATAVFALIVGFGVHVDDHAVAAVLAAIPTLAAILVRNAATNLHTPAGKQLRAVSR